jgi:phenylpropionate dioxygenase-like ring-hydroxylating dioxygenase large terminal subunit
MLVSAMSISAGEAKELLENLEAGFALPSRWYADAAIFEAERELVLRRSWHFAAHTGQLAHAGDQVVCDIAGVPVVLVVDQSGAIGGFVNICRHRAHMVVQESCNRPTLQCLYHGWTYNLDGRLRRAPRAETEMEFNRSEFGLLAVQTAVWGPTVWVNIDGEAPPFSDWIGGLPDVVAADGVDVGAHLFAFEKEWEIRANWKVFLDNAIECYHCPTCHPALRQVLEMDPHLQQISVGGRYWSSHQIPLRQTSGSSNIACPTGPRSDGNYHFHWIFPTTYFQYAGGGFDIGSVTVRDVNELVFRHLSFMPADMPAEEIAERKSRLESDPTASEDVAICNRVQRAHETGIAPPGRLLPGSEWLLQHYQRVLIEDMANLRAV